MFPSNSTNSPNNRFHSRIVVRNIYTYKVYVLSKLYFPYVALPTKLKLMQLCMVVEVDPREV